MGTKLLEYAVNDLFDQDVDAVILDACDAAVKIVLKLGGEVTEETQYFYGCPITPTII